MKKHRGLALLLSLCLVAGMLPSFAIAAPKTRSGQEEVWFYETNGITVTFAMLYEGKPDEGGSQKIPEKGYLIEQKDNLYLRYDFGVSKKDELDAATQYRVGLPMQFRLRINN